MQLTSSVIETNGTIPKKYTCDGEDVSPPLSWTAPPEKTESFALIADDPDAPMGTWVHWVIYNIPSDVHELAQGISPIEEPLGKGVKQGKNDFGKIGYGGPCPPPGGPHRYFFKLYALDKKLELTAGATKKDLLAVMDGHILGQTELIGKYQR